MAADPLPLTSEALKAWDLLANSGSLLFVQVDKPSLRRLVAMARRAVALERYVREDDRYCSRCLGEYPFDHECFADDPLDVDALLAEYATAQGATSDEH